MGSKPIELCQDSCFHCCVPEGLNVLVLPRGSDLLRSLIREDFMRRVICTIAAATLAFSIITPMATAQQSRSSQQATTDPASNPDQELGRRFLIKAEALPPPKTDPIAASRSLVVPYAGQVPRVMEGFTATPFVTGLEHPRRLLVLPNNDVIVAEQKTGYLTLLRDQDGDGKVDFIERWTSSSALPTTSRHLTGLHTKTASFSLPIRTASGACRMSAAHCAPVARISRRSPTCRRKSASLCRRRTARK